MFLVPRFGGKGNGCDLPRQAQDRTTVGWIGVPLRTDAFCTCSKKFAFCARPRKHKQAVSHPVQNRALKTRRPASLNLRREGYVRLLGRARPTRRAPQTVPLLTQSPCRKNGGVTLIMTRFQNTKRSRSNDFKIRNGSSQQKDSRQCKF